MKQTDDSRRFHELVWPHCAAVLRAARIHTGNVAEADDLAQETLLKAFRSIGSLNDGAGVRAWLLTILRNTRIDRLRTASGSAKHVSLDQLQTDPAIAVKPDEGSAVSGQDADVMLEAFSDEQVIHALQAVSEDLRWTLLLVDVEGVDHAEAAEIMGVPVGTVKSRVHRGRAALRQSLRPLALERRFIRH